MNLFKTSAFALALVCFSTAVAAPDDLRSSEYWRESSPTIVDVGAGMAVYGGSTGFTVNVGALKRISTDAPLFFGADLALNFWNFSTPFATRTASATGIQLLPTLVYGLRVPTLRGVNPYVGVSMGPNIYISQVNVAGISGSSTNVYFELLFRPGVRVDLSRSFALNIEPKFGILQSGFIFLPQANLVVAL